MYFCGKRLVKSQKYVTMQVNLSLTFNYIIIKLLNIIMMSFANQKIRINSYFQPKQKFCNTKKIHKIHKCLYNNTKHTVQTNKSIITIIEIHVYFQVIFYRITFRVTLHTSVECGLALILAQSPREGGQCHNKPRPLPSADQSEIAEKLY